MPAQRPVPPRTRPMLSTGTLINDDSKSTSRLLSDLGDAASSLTDRVSSREAAAASIEERATRIEAVTPINVASFGAVGDGVTDDTQAIQRAIDAASNHAGVVYVPTGSYAISDTLSLPTQVVLRGSGRGIARIFASSSFPTDGRPMARLGRTTDTLVFGCRIECIMLDANSRAGTCVYTSCAQEQCGIQYVAAIGFTQYGVHFDGNVIGQVPSGVFVKDCEVYPQASGATDGIFFDGSAIVNHIIQTTVGVSGPLTNGLHVRSAQVIVAGLHMENCTNGVNLDSGAACVLMGINPAGFGGGAPVGTVILDSFGNNHSIGIGLVKNNATLLIGSPFFGVSNADAFMPLWVGGDSMFGGAIHLSYEHTPPAITANQNDYDLGVNGSFADVVMLQSTAPFDITGIKAANKGRIIWFYNFGAFNITLKNLNGGSSAANRIVGRNGADTILAPLTGVQLYYTTTFSNWLILGDTL